MKRSWTILLLVALVLMLCCGAGCNPAQKEAEKDVPTAEPEIPVEPAATAEPEPTPAATEVPAATEAPTEPAATSAVKYTVTWYDHNGEKVLYGPTEVEAGAAVPAVAEPTLEYFAFAKWIWYDADGRMLAAAPMTVTGNLSAWASWNVSAYNPIVWYDSDGTTELHRVEKVRHGDEIPTIPDPTKPGKVFTGWTWYDYMGRALAKVPFEMPKTAITARANWRDA